MITVFHPFNEAEWFSLLDELEEHDLWHHYVLIIGKISDSVEAELLEFLDGDDNIELITVEEAVNSEGSILISGVIYPIPADFYKGYLHTIVTRYQHPQYHIGYRKGNVTVEASMGGVDDFYNGEKMLSDLEFDNYVKPHAEFNSKEGFKPCDACMEWVREHFPPKARESVLPYGEGSQPIKPLTGVVEWLTGVSREELTRMVKNTRGNDWFNELIKEEDVCGEKKDASDTVFRPLSQVKNFFTRRS